MPLKAELNAVKKNYVKLMKLPVKELLPALKVADVVSDDQREQMNAMTLDKERAEYLIDNVITPSLKVDILETFYNFLQVLEDDDNPVVKVVANDLRSQLGPSMPPQPCEHPSHQGQTSQQHPLYQGQTPQQYQGQTSLQYPPHQEQTPQQYPPSQEQTPQQYHPYQGHALQQYPPSQGQTPQQYPLYQGQTPQQYQEQTPQQYPPYQGQIPQQYPPYQGHALQQYSPPQGQTPQQYPPYQGQVPQEYSSYQEQMPIPQPSVGPTQMKKVKSCLANASNEETDSLPANNRNVHAVCLIRRETAEGTEIGTGFIANFTMPNSSSPVTILVTNHHVIHNLREALEATYQFSYLRSDSSNTPHAIKGKDLISQDKQTFYTCNEYERSDVLLDYTLIQVHERPLNDITIKSELDGETFPLSTCKFDLDNPAMPSDIDEMETVCILHYPRGQPLKRSAQGSVSVGHLLFYHCDTDGGSSGAPVFKVVNKELRVIALHRAHWGDNKFNFGTLITDVIKHVYGAPSPRMNYSATYSEPQQRVK